MLSHRNNAKIEPHSKKIFFESIQLGGEKSVERFSLYFF